MGNCGCGRNKSATSMKERKARVARMKKKARLAVIAKSSRRHEKT